MLDHRNELHRHALNHVVDLLFAGWRLADDRQHVAADAVQLVLLRGGRELVLSLAEKESPRENGGQKGEEK